MKKITYYSKFLCQSLIFIFEVALLVGGSTYILSIFYPVSTMHFIERFISILAFYQLFVFSTLKLYDDSQKDSLNTVKTNYKESILMLSYFSEKHPLIIEYKKMIKRHIQLLTHDSVLNTNEVLYYYEYLENCLEEDDVFGLKMHLIHINHTLDLLDLEFMHSFFLRFLKSILPKHVKDYSKEHNIKNIK